LAQALSARFNVDEVLEEAHRGASRLISAENFYVGLYDPEAEQITIRFNSAEARADRQITTLDVDQGLTGYVIRNRRPLLIKHNVQKRMTELGVELVGEPARSWLGVPLMVGDRVLGMMAIQSYDESHLYDEHDQGLLTAIASQTAIALQSADLFEQTEQRARRERLIREVTTKIVGSTDLDTVLQTTAQELGKVLGTSRAVVRLSTSSDVDGQEDEVEGPTDG
jgi:GAF domain-containing protein